MPPRGIAGPAFPERDTVGSLCSEPFNVGETPLISMYE
jgi:hypothetical protein